MSNMSNRTTCVERKSIKLLYKSCTSNKFHRMISAIETNHRCTATAVIGIHSELDDTGCGRRSIFDTERSLTSGAPHNVKGQRTAGGWGWTRRERSRATGRFGLQMDRWRAHLGCFFFYWNFLRFLKHSNNERGLVNDVESEIRRTFLCVVLCSRERCRYARFGTTGKPNKGKGMFPEPYRNGS